MKTYTVQCTLYNNVCAVKGDFRIETMQSTGERYCMRNKYLRLSYEYNIFLKVVFIALMY